MRKATGALDRCVNTSSEFRWYLHQGRKQYMNGAAQYFRSPTRFSSWEPRSHWKYTAPRYQLFDEPVVYMFHKPFYFDGWGKCVHCPIEFMRPKLTGYRVDP